MSENSTRDIVINSSDEWGPLADLLADLIAKYADEMDFEGMPDPDKYLLKRAMEESYRRYTARRNRIINKQISLEYVMTDS